jgi:tRNA nucleotidyltransferase (CCA-adding enzyme)
MILKKHGFKVIQSHLWSNDKKCSLLFFKLESYKVASTYLHLGPPVEMAESSYNFLDRHLYSSDTSSGPWIESGRWMVEKIQNETSAIGLLKYLFDNGGRKIGLPSNIMRSIKKGYRIMLNEENIALNEIPEASRELFNFIMGRPSWLEIIKT